MNDARSEASLSFEILGALQAVASRLEEELEPLGLSLAKFGALSRLVDAGRPLPLGTLAERCACVRSNITQLVDRLEAERLVVRIDDPKDRRSVLAELTDQGRSRHAAGERALEAVERELLARIPDDQRAALRGLLQALGTTS
jgi:DNA-binding MarR family transcriptional regulator